MSRKNYLLCLIAILLKTSLSVTTNLEATKSVGQVMQKSIYNQENSFLISGREANNYAIIDIDSTGEFTTHSNADFTFITDFKMLPNNKLLTCGQNGVRTINKLTGDTEIENLTTEAIFSVVVIKDTQLASIAPRLGTKLIILKLEDLSKENDFDMALDNNFIMFQSRFTNLIYLGFADKKDFISVDYTNLQKITLADSPNQNSIFSIAQGRDKQHLLTVGATPTIAKVDVIASSITKELEVAGSATNNINMRYLLGTSILMGASSDSGIWYMDWDSETTQLFINEPGYEYCFNPATMMIGVTETASPYDFFIYSFAAVTCTVNDCTQCPFLASICVVCGNGKKLQEGTCVDECSSGYYYDAIWKTCFLDHCEGGRVFNIYKNQCLCPTGEVYDESTNECFVCQNRFDNCFECNSEKCLQCQDKYEFNDEESCIKIKSDEPPEPTEKSEGTDISTIIGIILFVTVGVIIVIVFNIIFIKYLFRSSKSKKDKELVPKDRELVPPDDI